MTRITSPCIILATALLLAATQFNCAKKPAAAPAPATPQVNPEETLAKVRSIVANKLEVDPKVIDVDAPLSKQTSPADELDAVEIILDIEDAFKIEIKEDEVGGSAPGLPDRLSVRKLTDIVIRKGPAK
jgi:acyl carrier protein